nr:MAG TPA: hypothetical protein [Bacteriophage sp.]
MYDTSMICQCIYVDKNIDSRQLEGSPPLCDC